MARGASSCSSMVGMGRCIRDEEIQLASLERSKGEVMMKLGPIVLCV